MGGLNTFSDFPSSHPICHAPLGVPREKSHRTSLQSIPPERTSQGRLGRNATALHIFSCPPRMVLNFFLAFQIYYMHMTQIICSCEELASALDDDLVELFSAQSMGLDRFVNLPQVEHFYVTSHSHANCVSELI
mmetsp:Transcript_8511/g.53191  ORF Transcript_8511/g.53191 Transcript_8511/m.53191 type:complete len:134 (-) Transcript_8511:385-786(-)